MDKNHSMIRLFNDEDILTFTRHLTQLINKLNYFKLQNEQWSYYYHLGITEGLWTGRISMKMALNNSMHYTYGRSKNLIEQRRKKYEKQLEFIRNEAEKYIKQPRNITAQIDMNNMMTIITYLIHKDQYQLSIELERRRGTLKFDAKDHQLVQAFYQLKPRKTEIHSAKMIWKTIHEEQKLQYEIAMFKEWLSLKTTLTNCTLQDLALIKINEIFTQLVFNKQLQPTNHLSMNDHNNQINSPNQYIHDLSADTLSKAEKLAQNYTQKVIDEKTKLLNDFQWLE
ncbi:unnamed protein product [Rotaria sp. Silwood2]|nr:unnamed protein product [Rotaria sp. Silwood2]